ncbi:MAG: hypothetical protein AAF611_20445 [Bacteroidota bacterium]
METATTNTILFKRKLPTMISIFGVGFFLSGIVVIVTGNWYGVLFCVVSLLFFQREGSEIVLDTKRYRKFTDILGFRFGSWKELPNIDYISVFSATETMVIRDFTGDSRVKNDVIVINLFHNGNHRIKVYTTNNKEKAFSIAKQIAERLKIDILDATEAESKWI